MKDIIYSIVIPVYNEEENLLELYHRLKKVLVNLDELYEIIFVNDGSMDRTRDIIYELRNSDPNIKLISFSRNFGHQTSVSAGLDFASGHATIMMDGDLQDPPEIIPRLIEKWQEGYKVVYALRKKRKEGLFKRFAYSTFYRLLKKISYIDIPLDSGDFSLIDRKVVDLLIKMPERNKFIRGLRAWVGFQQIGIEYERDKRYAGEPKYSLNKLLNLALDGLISFSYAPLKLATSFGFVVSGFAFFGAIFTFIQRITIGTIPGFATTVISILFLGGIQLMTIGILGEYIGRIYDEVKQRPLYIVEEIIGFDGDE